VTLTFDNGPDPETTPAVLDILKRFAIESTFFIVGNQLAADGSREILERIAHEGHGIGNHTYSHNPPLGERTSPDTARDEIQRTQDLIGALGAAKLFRPSGTKGALDRRLLTQSCVDLLVEDKYTCVLWHCVPGDLQGLDWVQRSFEDLARRAWTMFVLHDIRGGALTRLDEFLTRLLEDGHQIVREFPSDCVPIVRGQMVAPLDGYVQNDGHAIAG
jgi:peptidoglycan/xylan/chitin deacetylase (PgdA/CDA1 family)